ncbi:MAG: RNA polymerase factor sigma-54 [Kiritimatiellae bacterium]|nr:RNA polymerase factor sigma-54 [Kiritimatiellia bacterium]
MAPGGELRQNQSQALVLAPQLRQGLKLLALSLPELRAELCRELSRNPVIDDVEQTLERETLSQKERESAEAERSFDNGYPEDDAMPDPSYSADADAVERRRRFFESRTKPETLAEHLLGQLETSGMDAAEVQMAELLVGDFDDNGYFAGDFNDFAQVTGESVGRIRRVLRRISALDPPGCGATSLKECLLAQLDKLDGSPYRDDVRELIERGHLPDVAAGRIGAVERDLGMSHERYADVLRALRTLDPHPGRAYAADPSFVKPEVHAVSAGGRWEARVDARSLPEIRISRRYLAMMEDPATPADAKAYIREKIAAARALADAVEHREETITRIAQAIFDAQPGFFENGLKGLKPLTMQRIADEVGVHHTTVSRTVRDKYASTPKGTVELRRFFVSGYVTEDGGAVSKTSVLDRVREIVRTEDAAAPLSDGRISEILKSEGCPVARRTVAKYRAALSIPGAGERRARKAMATRAVEVKR